MKRARLSPILLAMTLGLLPAIASAQTNTDFANITASANVAAAIDVQTGNNLLFGTVLPNVSKAIAVTDAGAGTFLVVGAASATVDLSFTLPGPLTGTGGNLTITNWDAQANTANDPTGGTNFDPSAGLTGTSLGAGTLYIFIGAEVQPTNTQAAGTYQGTITLTATYNSI